MIVKLQILASDIKEDKYYVLAECAITKALERAGLPNLRDTGYIIMNLHNNAVKSNNIGELQDRVLSMYKWIGDRVKAYGDPIEEPKDFEFELDLDYK